MQNNDLISRSEAITVIMMLPHNGDIVSSEEVEQALPELRGEDGE